MCKKNIRFGRGWLPLAPSIMGEEEIVLAAGVGLVTELIVYHVTYIEVVYGGIDTGQYDII